MPEYIFGILTKKHVHCRCNHLPHSTVGRTETLSILIDINKLTHGSGETVPPGQDKLHEI